MELASELNNMYTVNNYVCIHPSKIFTDRNYSILLKLHKRGGNTGIIIYLFSGYSINKVIQLQLRIVDQPRIEKTLDKPTTLSKHVDDIS